MLPRSSMRSAVDAAPRCPSARRATTTLLDRLEQPVEKRADRVRLSCPSHLAQRGSHGGALHRSLTCLVSLPLRGTFWEDGVPDWSGHSYDLFVRYAHADNGKPPSLTGCHLTVQENRTNRMLRSGVKSSTGTSSLILFHPTPLIVSSPST